MFTEKTFRDYLRKRKTAIDGALNTYLDRYIGSGDDVFKAIKYAIFPGGKRIRPVLCLEACEICGGNIKKALPAACAIEFIHNFSLIHDDLPSMDNDDLRRGRPACHKKYGEAVAILAGNALLALAYEVMSFIGDPATSQKLVRIISRSIGLRGMIGGQGLDIKYNRRKKSNKLQSKINMLKTAELFIVTLKSGAVSAKAPEKHIKALGDFGRDFGEAFQLRDDIHDDEDPQIAMRIKNKALKRLVQRAKANLEIFGEKADNLRYIADYLAR